jgi:hypothetical protein
MRRLVVRPLFLFLSLPAFHIAFTFLLLPILIAIIVVFFLFFLGLESHLIVFLCVCF